MYKKSLKQRQQHIYEELDNPDFKDDNLAKHLNDLKLVNVLFGSSPSTLRALFKLIKGYNKKELTIVDIGSGGGDLLIAMAKKFRKKRFNVKLIGVDLNINCINYAKQCSKDYEEISYIQGNVLDDNFQVPECDFLISTHFLDHLSDQQFIDFITKQSQYVKKAMLISEVERIPFSYYFFKYTGPILFPNKITVRDCLNAIKRAFKKKELMALLTKNKIKNFKVKRVWSFHLLLTIFTTDT